MKCIQCLSVRPVQNRVKHNISRKQHLMKQLCMYMYLHFIKTQMGDLLEFFDHSRLVFFNSWLIFYLVCSRRFSFLQKKIIIYETIHTSNKLSIKKLNQQVGISTFWSFKTSWSWPLIKWGAGGLMDS